MQNRNFQAPLIKWSLIDRLSGGGVVLARNTKQTSLGRAPGEVIIDVRDYFNLRFLESAHLFQCVRTLHSDA